MEIKILQTARSDAARRRHLVVLDCAASKNTKGAASHNNIVSLV